MDTSAKPKEISEGAETASSQAPRMKKYLATAVVCYCTFAYGAGFTFLGPTVNTYATKFGVEVDDVTVVFSILTGSYLVGALANGILNNFVRRQLIVLVLMAIGGASLFVFPHVSTLGLFFMLAAFLGFFGGGYDSAQIAWVIDIWRHEAAPFILTQHFSYSIGTVVPPLILSPFLPEETDSKDSTTMATSTTTETNRNATEVEETQLWIPFSVAGCIIILGIVIQIVSSFTIFRTPLNETGKEKVKDLEDGEKEKVDEGDATDKEKSKFKFPDKRKVILIVLSCFCMAFYQGLELGTMQFLPTFAHYSNTYEISESAAADILFGLTIAFCVCRGIGILVVLKVPPHFILCGNFVLLLASNLILFFAGESKTLIWVGSVLLGAAMSTTFPSYFAYIEKYLFISDTVSAIILVCAGGVSAIYPIIVGNSVKDNPAVMVYVNFLSLAVLVVCFAITFWLTYFKGKKDGQHSHLEIIVADSDFSINNNNNEGFTEKY